VPSILDDLFTAIAPLAIAMKTIASENLEEEFENHGSS